MSTSSDDTPVTTVPEQKSRWEDYLDVFMSPRELFERRRNTSLTAPLVTLCVLAVAFYYIMLPAVGMMQRAVTASSGVPPEVAARMAGFFRIMMYAGGIIIPVTYLIMVALTALIMWLVARLVDARPSFHDMMVVATYAAFIYLLGSIATQVAILLHGEAGLDPIRHTSFGVVRFISQDSVPRPLLALLGRIDIFKIWQAVVWAIGFEVVTGVSRGKAALVAGLTWIIAALPGMLGGGPKGMGNVQMKTGE